MKGEIFIEKGMVFYPIRYCDQCDSLMVQDDFQIDKITYSCKYCRSVNSDIYDKHRELILTVIKLLRIQDRGRR